ncbi:MAG: TetR/AcrR family transcriptional regulator [Desulfobacteraceae bacterium]|jgi:AcrR family transcriptional regulator
MAGKRKKKQIGPDASERLMEAATTLFAERGFAGTTVQKIADRAGVTKPVLYYYFQSKAGIFRAILDSAGAMQLDLLEEVADAPGTVLDRLLLLYHRLYEGIAEYPNVFRLIHNLLFGPPQGVPDYDYNVFHRRMLQAIQAIYVEGLDRNEVADAEPEEVAMLVQGLLDFCFHHDLSPHGRPGSCRPERLLRMAFQGLGR